MNAAIPTAGTVKLITVVLVHMGKKEGFLDWNGRATDALLAFPGFISREVIPPLSEDMKEWVIVNRFDSIENLRAWRASDIRTRLFAEAKLLIDGEPTELIGDAAMQYLMENSVTEVIFEQPAPGKETAYQEWSNRIQKAQALSSGYLGGYTQPPKRTGAGWMTLMRFASVDDLNKWMSSPVRQSLLNEGRNLVATSYQHQVETSFPGWAPTDPASGRAPANWKTTMLVLLGLYPIVALELLFLMKPLLNLGLKSAFAGFIGNALSVTLVSYVSMPFLCRWLDWWLLPASDAPKNVNMKGTLIVAFFYILSIAIFWNFL